MASYPSSVPALTNPTSTDPLNSPSHSSQHSTVNDEIEAICTELGALPKGAYSNVTARLDAIDATLSGKTTVVASAPGNFLTWSGGTIADSGYDATDFAVAAHNHNSSYYTEAEVDAALALKNNVVTGSSPYFVGFNGGGSMVQSAYGPSSFEATGSITTAINAHLAVHTITVDHNPFILGTKSVDETNIADNRVLYFDFESNQIRYDTAAALLALGRVAFSVVSAGGTTITLPSTPLTNGMLFLAINGIVQNESDGDYTYTGTTVTFDAALSSGDVVFGKYEV